MANSQFLEDSFGWWPFDHFLMKKWDPELSLPQDEQERNLVKEWIGLGERGRAAYFGLCDDIPLPHHIPSSLSAFEKRKTKDPDNWGVTGVIWIRTWYGNEASLGDTPVEEAVTRASADEAYLRLWQKVSCPPEYNYRFEDMFGPNVFDDNDAAYGVAARDADDEVELMDDIPPFILSALMRCPDVMEGSSQSRRILDDADLQLHQRLLVVVADREACEDGWVLLIALNHKGQVLHMRVRCKAYQVALQLAFFRNEGEPLDILEGEENVLHYLDGNGSGNGWDED